MSTVVDTSVLRVNIQNDLDVTYSNLYISFYFHMITFKF